MTRHSTGYGAYIIEPMPSQPQLALCHGFFVKHDMRGRGLAHTLKADQGAQLQADGYDYAICTVDVANLAQQRVVEAAGWKRLAEFKSAKTGGQTLIYGWATLDSAEAK